MSQCASRRLILMVWMAAVAMAHVCYLGDEPDPLTGKMRWSLQYRDPCNCTELRPGGTVGVRAPHRPYQPKYLSSLVITENRREIRRLLSCSTPLKEESVCEGTHFSVSCGDDGVIDVKWAFYGRQSGRNLCNTGGSTQCGSADASLMKVQEICQGQVDCSFTPDNGIFSLDPCPGKHKYLVVRYTCSA